MIGGGYCSGRVSSIPSRIAGVRARIAAAAESAGRNPDSVLVVAVSKTKPAEAIREAYAAGIRDFGENYVQEMAHKAELLGDLPGLRFHFVGHLQRNKAKVVAKIASAVHGMDSVRVAQELGKRAGENPCAHPAAFSDGSPRLPVLVEVNVGAEVQKSGCSEGDLPAILEAIEAAPALRLSGLMTVPPHTDDPEGARPYFEALRALRDAHGGARRLPELSMGMTHDLEQAVRAGATIVRVGTAIFGERGG